MGDFNRKGTSINKIMSYDRYYNKKNINVISCKQPDPEPEILGGISFDTNYNTDIEFTNDNTIAECKNNTLWRTIFSESSDVGYSNGEIHVWKIKIIKIINVAENSWDMIIGIIDSEQKGDMHTSGGLEGINGWVTESNILISQPQNDSTSTNENIRYDENDIVTVRLDYGDLSVTFKSNDDIRGHCSIEENKEYCLSISLLGLGEKVQILDYFTEVPTSE